MNLHDFCQRLAQVSGLSNAQKAVAILWFFDVKDPNCQKSAPELGREIREHNIGNPNPTQLTTQIRKTGCVYSAKNRFHLRQDKKAEIRSWFEEVLSGVVAEVPHDAQFLSEDVWRSTRGYIEKVCVQLNGAIHQGLYDCAAVMVRRVIETLIIEAYEKQERQEDIKDDDGNYYMLGKLVEAARSTAGLSLGRETKQGLVKIKKLGDRSAHNRKYNAKHSDLYKVQDALRLAFEELANTAGLCDT